MCVECVDYSFDIIDDTLIVKNHTKEYKVKLTDEQCLEINKRTSALTQKCDRSGNGAFDAWGCMLKIDDQIYYQDNEFSFTQPLVEYDWQFRPEEIILLIEYIVNLSPIPINLYWH
jgi:hypothetical protein